MVHASGAMLEMQNAHLPLSDATVSLCRSVSLLYAVYLTIAFPPIRASKLRLLSVILTYAP